MQTNGLGKDGTEPGKEKAAAVMHTVTAELDNFKVRRKNKFLKS